MKFTLKAPRRWFAALALSTLTTAALAQPAFPTRPVKIVVPFAPGGSSDSATRIIAEQLQSKWKQPVVIENRPGANGSIGASMVAKSPADGYTLLLTPVSIGTVNIFVKNPSFDPLKDLAPVTQVVEGDYVLAAQKGLPVNTMAEFAAYAKANPTKVFHGTFGGASMLAFEQFSERMGFRVQNVTYRGEAPALNALLGGEVQVVLATLVGARPFIESERIKALGIPSKTRSTILPEVPTADESGAKGFHVNFWFGLTAPAGTPRPVIDRIGADVAEVLARPDVKGRLFGMGLVAKASKPEAFGQVIKYESERWVETARRAGVEPQ